MMKHQDEITQNQETSIRRIEKQMAQLAKHLAEMGEERANTSPRATEDNLKDNEKVARDVDTDRLDCINGRITRQMRLLSNCLRHAVNRTSHQLTAGLSSSSSRQRWCASNDISTSPHRRVLGRKPSPSSRLLVPRLHVVVVAVIVSSPSSASSLGLSDSLCLFRWLGGAHSSMGITSSSLEARATKK
ncbi:uncharacterized protein LOC107640959 [Arachis ipaensis]|uniref:uncharacterized protein LOC107640959 n=1 Tax=Arachis ipaensis TaxID=130454 RepID=UPI0007AF1741|nr:uncharacterized protein LOC107640959 [Arachis ipaensis]